MEAAGFVEGWLEARGIEVATDEVRGLPVLKAEVGPEDAPTVVLHGHLDVVPAHEGQFEPRIDGDRLYGRGAYDMKGALAAMLVTTAAMRDQDGVRVRLGIVGDEESEEEAERGSDHLVDSGFLGDFAITGEPTDLQIGSRRRGCWRCGSRSAGRRPRRDAVAGRQRRAQGARRFPQHRVATFARQSSELFDRPSINLGRILGGDALNKVPDRCAIDVDIRYLPEQDPETILGAGAGDRAEVEVETLFAARRRSSTATRPSSAPCARRRRSTTRASR